MLKILVLYFLAGTSDQITKKKKKDKKIKIKAGKRTCSLGFPRPPMIFSGRAHA